MNSWKFLIYISALECEKKQHKVEISFNPRKRKLFFFLPYTSRFKDYFSTSQPEKIYSSR